MVNKKCVITVITLDPNCELKFRVNKKKKEKFTLELKSGLAEIFGTELINGKKYEFTAYMHYTFAVYTWQGCIIELVAKSSVHFLIEWNTPMCLYLNCHAALEQMRETAEKDDTRGPVTMIVGSRNVGKSTLCRILLNYAVRIDRRPIFVDLDINQGHIAIPGTVASGVVINTCFKIINNYNLIEKNYNLLMYAAQVFEVDVILVMDRKLYNKLVEDMPHFVKVFYLPKTTGSDLETCAQRIKDQRKRDQSIREYFYGSSWTPLYPNSFEVKWNEVKLYKIEASSSSASCVLSNSKLKDNLTKLVAVKPGPNLLHHLLSVSFVDSPKDDVVQTNVAGFVCVINVDVDRQTFTVLSPQPGPLPNTVLLLSDIQFMNSLEI
ncbi:Protein CLP1 like protein [Trachymyrmex cornetzi]|uniref:Protein CLP1 like protein n=1 Tax=Trachymyrmex cornetzi TaxID=471704 RepID=A0A151J453_9HYME|nr:Protein CLP1 like protein [Trachymyrmex cornetzi]